MQKVEKPNKKTVENQSAESKNDKIGGLLFQISELNIIIGVSNDDFERAITAIYDIFVTVRL